ncbi:MAG: hypothetical protein J5I93_05700 [Pirellulaceae bacterium]|nr:hypothetical protein [Pirellulaceae bacterium]
MLDQQVRRANFLCLPDKRVIATVGLYDGKKFRTCHCEFHPATGKFTELIELSTAELPVDTGLAWHDGHVWVSYPAEENARVSVHLAEVKLR